MNEELEDPTSLFREWTKPQVKRLYCFVDASVHEEFRRKCLEEGFNLQSGLASLVEAYLQGTIIRAPK